MYKYVVSFPFMKGYTMFSITEDIKWLSGHNTLDGKSILESLLFDHTTKENIVWNTNEYEDIGIKYDEQITMPLLWHCNLRPRVLKNVLVKKDRTKKSAEVFTPLWVVCKMCDLLDDEIFGRPNVFFKDGEPVDKILFNDTLAWRDYVRKTCLEITCGEGPYLVSRYDVSTGEEVILSKRVGLLDRKLRVISENTFTERDWINYVYEAYKSSYGYELIGDNLLLARINLYMTFVEMLNSLYHREPTPDEITEMVEIITWNVFQMNGLTYTTKGNIPVYIKLWGTDDQQCIKFKQLRAD